MDFSNLLSTLWDFAHNKKLLVFFVVTAIVFEWRQGYFKGFIRFLKSFPWKPYKLFLIATSVLIFLALFFDTLITEKLKLIGGEFRAWILNIGESAGQDFWVYILFAYIVMLISKQERFRQFIFGAIITSGLSGLVISLFKFSFLRARPERGEGPFSFFNWEGILKDEGDFQSFPSGDVAIVAGAAFYLFFSVKNVFFRVLMLLIPLTTALSRIDKSRHWPSDALLSFMISLVIAHFFSVYASSKKMLAEPKNAKA